MLYFSKLKIISVIIFTLLLSYFSLSNFTKIDDDFFKKNINLGLDLQGGSYLLLEIDNSPVLEQQIQNKLNIPLIFSATRGVHKRMLQDLQRYTKFFAISKNAPKKQWAITEYRKTMKKCGIKTKQMSKPETLELAKILCDTSYLGWLINYAQLTNTIAIKHNVNYDEMWTFSDEIHEALGNRPKMFPGFIGGHCVIPNLDLMQNQTLNLIKSINKQYSKQVKDSKNIYKKYTRKT